MIRSRYTDGKRSVKGGVTIEGYPTALAYALKSVLLASSVFSGGYQHNFDVADADYNNNAATNMMTVEVNQDDDGNSQFFQDMNGQSFAMDINVGAAVVFNLGLLGTGQTKDTKTTAVFLTERPFRWDQCSISWDGVADYGFESLNISIGNNLEARHTMVNTYSPQYIKRSDVVAIDISGQLTLQSSGDSKFEDAFNAQTEHVFRLDMKNEQGNTIGFSIPNLRISAYQSNISGPGLIDASFSAEAFYNQGSESAILISVVNSEVLLNNPFTLNDSYYGLLGFDYNILIA